MHAIYGINVKILCLWTLFFWEFLRGGLFKNEFEMQKQTNWYSHCSLLSAWGWVFMVFIEILIYFEWKCIGKIQSVCFHVIFVKAIHLYISSWLLVDYPKGSFCAKLHGYTF